MGTHNFIQEHIDVGVNSIKAAKSIAGKDQKTLQAIVGILFDGSVDENLNITINGLHKDFGDKHRFTVLNDIVVIRFGDIFHSVFNYNTVDEVLTYTDVVTGSESSFKNTSTQIFKIAEGIYGRTDIKYEFTDSTDVNNPLEPFYEYLPK
jgi:hypothetical protein